MSLFSLNWMNPPEESLWSGAVTVGNFDGVHRGHRELLRTARRWADQLAGPCLAVTFDPPPVILLNPSAWKPPLVTLADRVRLLHEAGADHVAILKSDAGLLSLSPEAFFEDVLQRFLGAKAVVEGYNFCFGRARAGDTKLLAQLCQNAGLHFEEVQPLLHDGEAISSSRVRQELQRGNLELVQALLSRNHEIIGTVVTGAQRGRTIGFPTANLGPVATLIPGDGVYAVWATVRGQRFPAAANVGPAPTFGEQARKVEVHLLDFYGDLYDQELRVEFVRKLRETKPFSGIEQLTAQLQQDIQQARQLLKRNSN